MIQTLVIDDEPLARESLILRLEEYPEFEVCAQADNGDDALLLATKINPDAIFMDIEMPGLNGMEAAKKIFDQLDCAIIFVTAYENRAVDAFRINALDYLLKPINDEQFRVTLDRIKNHQRIGNKNTPGMSGYSSYLKRLGIKDNRNISMIDVNKIQAIEVAGDYLCISVDDRTLIHRQALKSLLDLLDPVKFARIHRSHAINVEFLAELIEENNATSVYLENGKRFPVSRRYQKAFRDLLKRAGYIS